MNGTQGLAYTKQVLFEPGIFFFFKQNVALTVLEFML